MTKQEVIGQYESSYHIFCKLAASTIREKKMHPIWRTEKSHYLICQLHQQGCTEFFGCERFTIFEKNGIGFHWDVQENWLNWWNMGMVLSKGLKWCWALPPSLSNIVCISYESQPVPRLAIREGSWSSSWRCRATKLLSRSLCYSLNFISQSLKLAKWEINYSIS